MKDEYFNFFFSITKLSNTGTNVKLKQRGLWHKWKEDQLLHYFIAWQASEHFTIY